MKAKYLVIAVCGIIAGSFVAGLAQDSPEKTPLVIKKKVPDFEVVTLMFQGGETAVGISGKTNELLKKRSAEGWEFVTVTSANNDNGNPGMTVYQYVFKRE